MDEYSYKRLEDINERLINLSDEYDKMIRFHREKENTYKNEITRLAHLAYDISSHIMLEQFLEGDTNDKGRE